LRLDSGSRYVLLLEAAFVRRKDSATIYRIVRGTHGALPLPSEGEAALIAALERFVAIQDLDSENHRWRELTTMLEDTDPQFLETALDEFLRFRRGTPELIPSVLPILDHPGPALREKAARLAGQILRRYEPAAIPAEEALRAELIARARRDPSVPVRVAATETLGAFAAQEIVGVLQEISADDPNQSVRYTAERILLDIRAQGLEPGETLARPD
jgi:HEAT repeat protein